MFWGKMMMKDKRLLKPLLLKLGVALTISFAGFLYTYYYKTRRITSASLPPSPHSSSSSSSGDKKSISGSMPATPTSCSGDAVSMLSSENIKEMSHRKGTMDALPDELILSRKDFMDEDEFLLPEFNDLVLEEFELHSNNTSISPRKDVDRYVTRKITVDKETEMEIYNLKNLVHILRERERKLEMQLLEYYGLKEQETAVMELQNRLRINSVEAKLFTLKIESLQADKKRLEAQVADHSKVVAELESARAKLRMLKRKVRLDEEHTKEQLSHLKNKVADIQAEESITFGKDVDIEKRLHRLKELERESTELRLANSRLQYENAELMRRLETTQVVATLDPEAEALKEANQQLKKVNEELTKEVEQLQVNRCSDVEELVYLKWVNACLRYELRNYKAPPGKTVARDLSRTLSPKSEAKAKQLILEYANSEGNGDKNILDFDSEYWSSSQSSSLTESGDLDDSSIDVSCTTKTNSSSRSKFFSKLRKLVHGKDSPKNHQSSVDRSPSSYTASGRGSVSNGSFEDMRTCSVSTVSSRPNLSLPSTDSTESEARSEEHTLIRRCQSFSRSSLDQRPRTFSLDSIKEVDGSRRNSDVGSSFFYRRTALKELGSVTGLGKDHQVEQDPASEKLELMKFAQVLKGSSPSPRTQRRSSYSDSSF